MSMMGAMMSGRFLSWSPMSLWLPCGVLSVAEPITVTAIAVITVIMHLQEINSQMAALELPDAICSLSVSQQSDAAAASAGVASSSSSSPTASSSAGVPDLASRQAQLQKQQELTRRLDLLLNKEVRLQQGCRNWKLHRGNFARFGSRQEAHWAEKRRQPNKFQCTPGRLDCKHSQGKKGNVM